MNEVIIRILDTNNNVLGDLDLSTFTDFPLVITKGIVNLDNLKTRTGTYTKNFKVPNTKNNSVLLSNVDDINSRKDFRDALGRKPCSIMVNGNEIEKGFVQVSKSYNGFDVESFELVFFGNNIDWVKEASTKKLNELTFANNSQVYNVDGIKDANNNTYPTYDHCYPYISRGGNEKPNDTEVRDYKPCFYLSSILKKGLNDCGWNVNSDFIDSLSIKKLACDFNGDMSVSKTTVDNSKTRASMNSSQTIFSVDRPTFFQDDTTAPNNDLNNNYDNSISEYKAPSNGRYVFNQNFEIFNSNYSSITSDHKSYLISVILVNGKEKYRTGSSEKYYNPRVQNTSVKIEVELELKKDDLVTFKNQKADTGTGSDVSSSFKSGSYFEIQRSRELIKGDDFSLDEVIPDDIKLLDVINDFTRMFNIYYWSDIKTKTIYFEPRDNFFKAPLEALDWSNKLDLSNSYEVDYVNSYKRNIKFSYKEDSSDVWLKGWEDSNRRKYAEYNHEMPDRFGEGTTEVKLDLFSASYAHDAKEATPLNENSFTTLKYWNEYKEEQPNERILGYNSRIINFLRGSQFEPNSSLRRYSFDGDSSTQIPYAIFEEYNNVTPLVNLSFTGDDGLFNTYYSKMLKNIEEGGRLIAYFNLTSTDFDNLDFRKLVYIDAPIQAKGYYLIESIIDYNPINNGLTKVILFKYENLGSVNLDSSQQGNNDSNDDNANNNVLEPIYIERNDELIEVWNELSSGNGYEPIFK